MKRRLFLGHLMLLPFTVAARADQAWTASVLEGNFDGKAYQAGLKIQLQPGWKTYWRNPGDGGIPPEISIEGDNLASFTIDAPLPTRIVDESGEAIGYHNEVVFPLSLTPKDAAAPLSITIKAFFGVCAKICTPAKFKAEATFSKAAAPSPAAQELEVWKARVPARTDFIQSASVKDGMLVLDLSQPLDDVFIEGPDRYYFRKPDLNHEHGKALLMVDGLKSDADLRGAHLRITAARQGKGLEQTIILAY